ncbi:unnamed protein product [Paramecium sonneborni]|uniref:Uncharacterized protein n=1 Tax=Paramecium sonneborni TaxID=65129 RepID=A0A8S1RSI4_9CILI|nr:unnamed protein product [Paramecium sonneborni]
MQGILLSTSLSESSKSKQLHVMSQNIEAETRQRKYVSSFEHSLRYIVYSLSCYQGIFCQMSLLKSAKISQRMQSSKKVEVAILMLKNIVLNTKANVMSKINSKEKLQVQRFNHFCTCCNHLQERKSEIKFQQSKLRKNGVKNVVAIDLSLNLKQTEEKRTQKVQRSRDPGEKEEIVKQEIPIEIEKQELNGKKVKLEMVKAELALLIFK